MSVYITSTGAFLPGDPVSNDQMEKRLGYIDGRPSRLKKRIVDANGIKTRHYAIDDAQQTTFQNEDLAYFAGQRCIEDSTRARAKIGMLSCASSQGDVILPGFASMVQARLGIPDVELMSAHGICSSSMMAVKAAYNALRLEDHDAALVVCSELASRLLKASRYEAVGGYGAVDFQAEFLRWMLSDGAGAWLLETTPRGARQPDEVKRGTTCFRIDWMHSFSHADALPVCMSVGQPTRQGEEHRCKSWQDFSSYAQAEAHGALLIRQDIRLLDHIVKLGVDGALRLIDRGILVTADVDHFLCHYSSHHFRGPIVDMLDRAGALIPEKKWFTNLYDHGNMGCASLLVMLDAFRKAGHAKRGDRILCMVPESGRFNVAYMHLTVVEAS